jgi:multicomponent Na+:H+ antiporter subunit D
VPFLLIWVPLFSIIILNLPTKDVMRKISPWLAGALFLCQVFLVFFSPQRFWELNAGAQASFLSFKVLLDTLSPVLFLSIGIVTLVALLIGCQMLQDEKKRFHFVNLLLLAFLGMNANVLVADLFVSYIFLEVTAITSFILISFEKERLALEGAFKYIILSAISSVMMLSSLALLFLIAGDTSFVAIRQALFESPTSLLARVAVVLFVCGLFIKGGVVPFHAWVPDAYTSAPAFVSVFLAGIVTKVSGVYVLIRLVVSVFGHQHAVSNIIMVMGALSILVGAVAALGQSNFKRMLAYSSISQVGYIILALGCGTPLAIAGAVFHLFNHSIFKTLLFVNAAAVEERVGTMKIEELGGLSNKMPWTGLTSVIGLLSAAGIPPLAGFWSKLIIVLALLQAGHYGYAGIALLASLLTLAYFLLMQRQVFFGQLYSGLEHVKEASFGLVFPAVVLAAITVGVGLFFPWMLERFILPIEATLR